MARKTGSSGPKTAEAIRRAGLALIHRHGYEAMSLRALAAQVGLQPGSLYNHFPTKQALLFGLIAGHMQELIAALGTALAGKADPVERLRAFVAFHVDYHLARPAEVFISYSELRSLEPENYAAIIALREAYERELVAILEAGARADRFRIADAKIAAYALLAMLSGVTTWYRPGGRLGPAEIGHIYLAMALGAVGLRPKPDVGEAGPRFRSLDRLA